jgi:hypothetical protein
MESLRRSLAVREVSYRRITLLFGVIAALLVVSGCASDDSGESNTVEGIVTEVTGDLTVVESLVIMDSEGKSHFFKPTPGLLFYGGPLSHLRDHVVTGQRVVVTFESGAYGEQIAVLIEHADADSVHEHSG